MDGDVIKLWVTVVLCYITVCFSVTDPGDFKVLNDFKNGLENPELLKWPEKGGDPCGPPSWPHVFCSNGRVTQIQVQGMGLKGTLPLNFNRLEKLQNLGLQKNCFNGPLPSFSGLAELQFVYLDFNQFDTIPLDFFHGLDNVRVLALDDNPFNSSTGWSIPNELQDSVQLSNFSCSSCNLIGPLPDFFGNFSSLSSLKLSYNRLSGELPASFRDSMLQILWLNDQDGDGMTGSIHVIESMVGLTQVWLHGNHFTGTIPNGIGALTSLRELNLNRNQLVGPIPLALANLNLKLLDLNNNMLMGPIPKFKAANVTYSSNSFCQSEPSKQCSPQVNALLDFLSDVNFPPNLACQWGGNDPCEGPWWGITCNSGSQVSVINLQRLKLNGTLSPSLANLDSLLEVHLGGNNLGGLVPSNLTQLKSLRLLELSGNNFEPPLPKFRDSVKIIINGNPLLIGNRTKEPPSPSISPSLPSPSTSPSPSSPINPFLSPLSSLNNSSPLLNGPPSSIEEHPKPKKFKAFKLAVIVVIAGAFIVLVLLAILFCIYCIKKKNYTKKDHGPIVVHPRDPSNPDNMVKIAILNDAQSGSLSACRSGGGVENIHVIESGNLVISVQALRKVTDNFSPENELGRGGFGTVYKGKLDDGTKLAVKRMEAGAIGNKALDEFHAEISVLSKVRHRHLVSLLGYSIEGNERLLVYEYLSKGALSMHLFRWKEMNLEPLSWTRRITIALDVARGMEYLHSLAHQIFIHRDLKSSNILLDDDFRAKVSDFGLVKLAPDRERSVATRLAGTFGYLAPEYAVTGKITTKVDVFSFGVVLIELLTGLTALDDHRPEESRYLVEWFWHIKSNRVRLNAIMDSALDPKDEIFDSMSVVAELAGHCTARDPNHRPDMGQAVNVLSSLVEKWKPFEEQVEEYSGIDYTQRLPQMLKCWQEAANIDITGSSLQDSKGSIPPMVPGFADSFNSSDAR